MESKLGMFGRLPYEVRELIWLEFMPRAQDTSEGKRPKGKPKADLSIIRTCRFLSREITAVIHHRCSMEFELSHLHRPGTLWTTVRFQRGYDRERNEGGLEDTRPRWLLESPSNARDRGFSTLPFHKLDDVTVTLFAPDPTAPSKLFLLLEKVENLVALFKRAKFIQKITIRLKKQNGCDWFRHGAYAPNRTLPSEGRYDYNVVAVPFCTLRNVGCVEVQAHSKELEDRMDWTVIKWATKTVRNRSWNRCVSSSKKYKAGETAEHDLDRWLAGDFLLAHREFWDHVDSATANRMRRDFLCLWFCPENDDDSAFERRILQIPKDYPEVIQEYDPNLDLLDGMHSALVCLHHWLRLWECEGKGRKTSMFSVRNSMMWEQAFPQGIPGPASNDYAGLKSMISQRVYSPYLKKGGMFSNMGHVIESWRARNSGEH